MRPVVKIDPNGEIKIMHEFRVNADDYGFNAPIDKYFDDESVDKLIYETR